jgi:hypothetical protein
VERHVGILREIAHELSTDRDRPDRPENAAEAEFSLNAKISALQASAPRAGLGAATGRFVDHIAALAERYGKHLFPCFDDSRIPPTTNGLEGFFGGGKRAIRSAGGGASTTNSLAQNLGTPFLLAIHGAPKAAARLREQPIDLDAYRNARAALKAAETPARRRRSYVRHLDRHLQRLVPSWHPP